MRRRLCILSVSLAACTNSALSSRNEGYLAPNRSADECRLVVQQVRSAFVDRAERDVPGFHPPLPEFLPMPPERPEPLRGRTVQIQFRVDEHGSVGSDDLRLIGFTAEDGAFAHRLKEHYRDMRFRPAVFEGCAVPFPRWLPLQITF
jgi:hypothetical protein